MHLHGRKLGVSLLAVAAVAFSAGPVADLTLSLKTTLDRITPDSLRGHVSFLASDLLEGRATPSRGLDIAAEYIAAQFRRAGLEPGGDVGYFQTAPFLTVHANPEGLRVELTGYGAIPAGSLFVDARTAVSLNEFPAVKYDSGQHSEAKVVFLYASDLRAVYQTRRLASAKPALLVVVGPAAARMRERVSLVPAAGRRAIIPIIAINDDKLADSVSAAPAGPLPFKVTVNLPAPVEKPVVLRNVIGVLRGSDPALKDTYELVTAHYDHLGLKADGEGDLIYNGANDDASGTASVIEIATALASMNPRPARTLVFIAFFGEEAGLLGSRYYGAHPAFPLARTVADVNLEHMGRTDSDLGPHVGMLNFTGFGFSEVPSVFKRAGEMTGVQILKDEKNSDAYFSRSDNQALADLGVPAHTISVSYEFPDYHQTGDEWQKIDYENMARVDRTVALGLVMIAANPIPPRWNEHDSNAGKYVYAWKQLHASPERPLKSQ
jgi:hypothetical protein